MSVPQSSTIDMHNLPKSYLANFENSQGVLYANKFKDEKLKKIISTSSNGVCYKPGYYKMPPFAELDYLTAYDISMLDKYDEQIVEGFINQYYENLFTKRLKLFRLQESTITLNWKFLFCQTLLHLFVRNSRIRDSIFTKEHLVHDAPNVKNEIRKEFSKTERDGRANLGISFEEYLDLLTGLYIDNINISNTAVLHNNFIIKQHFSNSPRKIETLWRMVQGRWDVLEANNSLNFIVTDNPSNISTIGKHTKGLLGSYELLFPLNARQVLCITTSNIPLDLEAMTSIKYVEIEEQKVEQINFFLSNNCNREIYSPDRKIIEDLRKRVYAVNQ